METQIPIKRKSSRRQPEALVPTSGLGNSNISTYVAIGAAGLALGVGYMCMKKIQQQQTDLISIKEKEKKFETFQNQIKQLEENNQLLYNKLQKSEQIQNRLGTQFNSITNQLTPQQTNKAPAAQAMPSAAPRRQHPESQRQTAPPESVSAATPKPTQVHYVESNPNIPQEQTPTRIVLSAEDKL